MKSTSELKMENSNKNMFCYRFKNGWDFSDENIDLFNKANLDLG